MTLRGLYKEPLKVRRIFKKINNEDSFFVELEGGSEREITFTEWNTAKNKRIDGDFIIFNKKGTADGDIVFSKKQAAEVDKLF